jgi:hypothetical protein
MFTTIKNWIAAKGGWAHVIALAYVAAVGAYAGVPPFAALLNSIYSSTPSWAHQLTLALLGLAAWYKNTSK